MASTGIHSAKFLRPSSLPRTKKSHHMFFSPTPFLPISNNTKKIPHPIIVSASITPTHQGTVASDSPTKNNADFPEKMDSWMQDSVTDIVKNLKQAPLLVQIYSEFDGRIKIQTEKAIPEKWPLVTSEWRSGESKSPDGLIFVEELEQDFDDDDDDDDQEYYDQDFGEGVTRAWGIVVQGRGVECGPACYLLKTNRVCSGLGLGFCTHFCLMRVNNFRDSALQQFKDSWLLQ